MSQLPLNIVPRLSYTAERFYLHSGIKDLSDEILTCFSRPDFQIRFIFGPKRSGKTHFSIWCLDAARKFAADAFDIEGQAQLSLTDYTAKLSAGQICIIDDADLILAERSPGKSGDFVAFVERLRALKGKLVLFSGTEFPNLTCDEHIVSRLMPGLVNGIQAPDSNDIPELVSAIGRQLGLKISARKVSTITTRIERSIEGVESFLQTAEARALAEGSFHEALRKV